MKWYQPIECNNTVTNPLVCDFSNLETNGIDQMFFRTGRLIDTWKEGVILQAKKSENDGDPDDALQNYLMMPVYSYNLMQLINENGIEGIQFLPIRILRPSGCEVERFYVANIINCIEAFDYANSIYNRFSNTFPNVKKRGKIAGVRKFVLSEYKLQGYDIIRLKDYNQRFFVSEKFKDIFVNNYFTGYSFKEVELT